ncbi:hypothetical protein VTK26DRAFT_1022 [Humicola hyalothermophila]
MTKQWDKYREVIIAEYKDQNRPLHEVRRMMMEKYGFRASIRAYRSRFDRWGIHKYSRRRRMRSPSINNGDSAGDETVRLSRQASPDVEDGSSPAASPAVVTPNELFGLDLCEAVPLMGNRGSRRLIKADFQYNAANPSANSVLGNHNPAFLSNQFGILNQFSPGGTGSYSSGSLSMYRQAHEAVMIGAPDPLSGQDDICRTGIQVGYPCR